MAATMFVLQRPDGQVLVEYRPSTDRYFPDQWVFPGGKQREGETSWQTMVREVGEELGVTVMESSPLDLPDLRYADPGQTDAFIVHAWLIRHWRGDLPPAILDTGYPLGWVTLGDCLRNRSGCVGPIAQAVSSVPLEPAR
jgi:mutator protein MutT